jgi:hypothetical protein
MRVVKVFAVAVITLGVMAVPETLAKAEVLITAEEAARPSDLTTERDLIRGPTVRVLAPAENSGTVTSPVTLQISFASHAGSKVDLSTLAVTYKKLPPVNLTDRVRPFATESGITMSSAQVPPGDHTILIKVRDTAGRLGWAQFSFSTTK